MKKMKRWFKYKLETMYVIMDCRRMVRNASANGFTKVNTRFLAHIASVPEWTIIIFNKPRKRKAQ